MKRKLAHRYAAHVRDEGPGSRQWVAQADSFLDAAVRFAETAQLPEGEVSIVVTECETGKDRCFIIDLSVGEINACEIRNQ